MSSNKYWEIWMERKKNIQSSARQSSPFNSDNKPTFNN
jgi:hypothetical protein